MRLIDVDALVANFRKTKMEELFPYWKELGWVARTAVIRLTIKYRAIILKAPTIEARPVVRGEWIEKPHTDGFGGYYFLSHCSRCNTPNAKKRNFCNECGADMRGDDDETD